MLVSKGMSLWGAALWSVTTSIPQPLMAIAAYSCVDAFVIIQPIGLGFAAGAMLWVAWLELFVESYEVRHSSRREPSGAPNPTPPFTYNLPGEIASFSRVHRLADSSRPRRWA